MRTHTALLGGVRGRGRRPGGVKGRIGRNLQKTQFGFRKNKSTEHALLIVRRIIDLDERKKSDKRKIREHNIQLLLLEGEGDSLVQEEDEGGG